MSKNSGATSGHSVSTRMESGVKESYLSGCHYKFEEPSVSKREPSADSL